MSASLIPLFAHEKNGSTPWSRTCWNTEVGKLQGPPQLLNPDDQWMTLSGFPPVFRCWKAVTAFQSHGASLPLSWLPTHAPQSIDVVDGGVLGCVTGHALVLTATGADCGE